MDEHQFEQAARVEQLQRDQGVAAAKARPQESQEYDDAGQVVCRGCGEPLSPERLKAQPDAARCVDCADLLERRGRTA